jgi:hypothetical protein
VRVRQWICRWHCSVHNICNGILPPHLASASSSRRSPPTPTPTSPDPAFPQGAAVWCASSILQRTTPIEMVDVGPRCTCGADSTLTRYSSRSTEEATPFAPKRGMPDPRVGGGAACRRLPWLPEMVLRHSVQDHRAKACNDDAYGRHVPSWRRCGGVVALHTMPLLQHLTRLCTSGRWGAKGGGRGIEDGVGDIVTTTRLRNNRMGADSTRRGARLLSRGRCL